jgi:hypothetical protein
MDFGDIKIFTLNTFTLGLTTFSNIEMSLKIILLILSIGYTISRWFNLHKGNGEVKDK